MARSDELYAELVTLLQGAELLGSCVSMLSWDEQTYLPTGGAEHRANQLGLLSGLAHDRRTAPRLGELLAALKDSGSLGDPDGHVAVNTREARRNYDRATKLPKRLVEELSRTPSLAPQAWVKA
ncbi:MAG TPA: carboxypeptidase M32, partial [Planctomycetaceae bacterium]|nr:carboxypeptidase M32 [Planctomycetaceae bacterium]